ncbi:BspA family leucine-rich repeat surface protein [Vibrio parahaemolyticus]|uniref:BspA family leucine-rich repeat surface protein n=1 Tax=Vibrio parahaemolyticus TaxID=670 RepID=UPI00146B013E|nr:BspA family leucine-rich repeat surface protein [Vibrio parahaemolyticus]MDF5453531.1 BspA family leucine-rich repeat surface protein [Vibrio parahaemolyticus]NMS06448.1 BspA family leucine-rich repeat surface protein [Vibrio parahaemolyticus]
MNKILLGMALFASVANAQQFVAVIDAKFTVKDSDQTPPANGCVGKELTRSELDTMIANGDDVTKACVGQIEDFSYLLTGYPHFNQDISNWDMSSAKTLSNFMTQPMAMNPDFDIDISGWDVSNVENFDMFLYVNLDYPHDLSGWNVDKATTWTDFYYKGFFQAPVDHIPPKFR